MTLLSFISVPIVGTDGVVTNVRYDLQKNVVYVNGNELVDIGECYNACEECDECDGCDGCGCEENADSEVEMIGEVPVVWHTDMLNMLNTELEKAKTSGCDASWQKEIEDTIVAIKKQMVENAN